MPGTKSLSLPRQPPEAVGFLPVDLPKAGKGYALPSEGSTLMAGGFLVTLLHVEVDVTVLFGVEICCCLYCVCLMLLILLLM